MPDRENVPRAMPNVDAQPCGRRSTGAMIALSRQVEHVDTGFATAVDGQLVANQAPGASENSPAQRQHDEEQDE
jgi:hypothetical protein